MCHVQLKIFYFTVVSHILILALTFYIINALYKIQNLLLPFKTAWMPKKDANMLIEVKS